MIKPTVGRVVWYHPLPVEAGYGHEHLAAIVAHVHSDTDINVMVIAPDGKTYGRESVYLWDGAQETTPLPTSYCEWMPYQKGQAAKTEQAEARMISAESLAASITPLQRQAIEPEQKKD